MKTGEDRRQLFEFVGPKDAETIIRDCGRSDIVVDLSRYDLRIRDLFLDPSLLPPAPSPIFSSLR